MKRIDLIQSLESQNCYLLRHGSRHDIYVNPMNGLRAPIPRQREISIDIVKLIYKQLNLGIHDDPAKSREKNKDILSR